MSTVWLLDLLEERYPVVFQQEDILKKILHECLMIHADYLAAQTGPVFFYSIVGVLGGKEEFFAVPDAAP